MELKSEPKFETFSVTDIDVAYPGEIRSLTLEDGKDTCTVQDNHDLLVKFATGEVVRLEGFNRHWYSIRPRTMRRKVEEPKS
jgi:hypothetical protein